MVESPRSNIFSLVKGIQKLHEVLFPSDFFNGARYVTMGQETRGLIKNATNCDRQRTSAR